MLTDFLAKTTERGIKKISGETQQILKKKKSVFVVVVLIFDHAGNGCEAYGNFTDYLHNFL